MKKQSLTRVFLLSLLILSIAFLAFAISPYLFSKGGEEPIALAEGEKPVIIVRAHEEESVTDPENVTSMQVLRGKSFVVDIYLVSNPASTGIASLELDLTYDADVMYLAPMQGKSYYTRGSALSSLQLTTTYFNVEGGPEVQPLQFIWYDAVKSDFSTGLLLSLRFQTRKDISDEKVTDDEHYRPYGINLTYKSENTFWSIPTTEGGDGRIHYFDNGLTLDGLSLTGATVTITKGAYICEYFDYDNSLIDRFEENDFTLWDPKDPDDPTRPSDRQYYYNFSSWDGVKPIKSEMTEEDKGSYELYAVYTQTPQPYTVYYYFGEMSDEGVLDIEETEAYYFTAPAELTYDALIPTPSIIADEYYSVAHWCVDASCETEKWFAKIPEDTSVPLDVVRASTPGQPFHVEGYELKLKLYSYKKQNVDYSPSGEYLTNVAKITHDVLVDGTTVNVAVNLIKNELGIKSMKLKIVYDHSVLTLNEASLGSAITAVNDDSSDPTHIDFWTTNVDTPYGYSREPFYFIWESNGAQNFYTTGNILNLVFTLDRDAAEGDYTITFSYEGTENEETGEVRRTDIIRFDENAQGVNSPLWYANADIVPGHVIVRGVEKPTAHDDENAPYVFNTQERTYTFATEGGKNDYTVTQNKRTDRGVYTSDEAVKVALNAGDNVYRFWKEANDSRSRAGLSFDFTIAARPVTAPTGHAPYTYNRESQKYSFVLEEDKEDYYTYSGTFTMTEVGEETITVSLNASDVAKGNIYWYDPEDPEDMTDVADKEYTFAILPYRVTIPEVPENTSYIYDTTDQTFAFTSASLEHAELYTITNRTRNAAGVYAFDPEDPENNQAVTCVLSDKHNYCWDIVGDLTEDLHYTFTIEKRGLTPPVSAGASYVYDGTEKTYALNHAYASEYYATYYSISGDKKTAANESGYKVSVSLRHPSDTYWIDEAHPEDKTNNEDVEFSFVIEKKSITSPTADATSFTFELTNDQPIVPKVYTYNLAHGYVDFSPYYTISGTLSKWQSGKTTITASLKDPSNHKWSVTEKEDASADLTYDFIVAPRSITKPTPNTAFTDNYAYTGSSITYNLNLVMELPV